MQLVKFEDEVKPTLKRSCSRLEVEDGVHKSLENTSCKCIARVPADRAFSSFQGDHGVLELLLSFLCAA